jgi:ABC-type branched-subunit amino acid transport system substrate-binding protein
LIWSGNRATLGAPTTDNEEGTVIGVPPSRHRFFSSVRFLGPLVGLAILVTAGGSAVAAAGNKAPSGTPIKVMTEAPVNSPSLSYPNIPGAAKIYEQWINAHGGIAGHPLQVITCDDRADAAEAAKCARTAAAEGVVANVGSFTLDASRAIAVLQHAGIAWFGACCTVVPAETSSKISFPMGCLICFPAAGAIKMADDGCKSIVEVYNTVPSTAVLSAAFANGYKSKGLDPTTLTVVELPNVPGDFSAQAAKMASADCVWGNIPDLFWPPLITALDGVGAHPRLYGLQGNLDSKVAAQFPKETEGAFVVGSYPDIATPVWAGYRAALKTYDAPDLDWNSLSGLGEWAAYTAFTKIAESIHGKITNVSFLAAANRAGALDLGRMVGGTLNFAKPWKGFGGQLPRLFNRTVYFDVIKNGKLTPAAVKPLDMTNPLDDRPG